MASTQPAEASTPFTSPFADWSVSCCLTSTCQARSICVNKAELWLQPYVDEVEAEARAGGAYGVGTERHLDGLAILAHLPPGAELTTVSVSYRGYAVLCPGDR